MYYKRKSPSTTNVYTDNIEASQISNNSMRGKSP